LPNERKKFFFKHNLGALVRADLAVRYAGYSSAITAGWMCRNEARQLEDMNQVKGLDKFTMPLNTATVNEDGSIDNPNQPDPTDTGATPPDTTQDTNSVPGDNGQNARLVALATACAERVVRKEAKTKSYEGHAKFVAEVMNIHIDRANEYVNSRNLGILQDKDDAAVAALVQLAMEE